MKRILSLLLALLLALAPGLALGVTENALRQQSDALVSQIMELVLQDTTFEYDGKSYSIKNGLEYANRHLLTEDDSPFCDALLEASLAHSDEVGELYLEEVRLLNELAELKGFSNYMDYACEVLYGIDFSVSPMLETIAAGFPATWELVSDLGALSSTPDAQTFLEEDDFLREAAAFYGTLCPDYQPLLESLIESDALQLETVPQLLAGGTTKVTNGRLHVTIRSYDDLSFTVGVMHEFGHSLYASYSNASATVCYPIYETHALGGSLLCLNAMEAFFRERTGDEHGAYLTLRYLLQPLDNLYHGLIRSRLSAEIFTNPDSFSPRDIARRYLELSLALDDDTGYLPDYQMLLGAQWMNSSSLFQNPFSDISYMLAAVNAVSLWCDQQAGGDALTRYNALVQTPIPDIPYTDYCRQTGLPDLADPASREGLDDFLAGRLTALTDELSGEE